jgi:hypothetical protein
MSNLIFFSEQGERFSVILNGVLQNSVPETNIKVTDLPAPGYKLKIIFEDKSLPQIDKNLAFKQGFETNFVIKKNNKNEYVVRWLNDVPLDQAMPPSQGQSVIVYTTVPAIQTSTTVTQSETTTINNNPGGGSVGFSVNDPSLGVNINLNMNGNGMGNNSQSSTYSSTTTTTTISGAPAQSYPPAHQEPSNPSHHAYSMPGYNGPTGCEYPMSPQDFSSAKATISGKSFEDSKLTIAKQIINTNCLLSAQVKEIMLLFSFEDTRLELAKYAYGYTWDTGNYYKLNDAFTFESSIDELNAFINGKSH